jgi:hypothetical protein
MEAADDEAVVGLVQHGQCEALVSARIGEGVEPNHALLGEVMARRTLHDRHPGRQLVQIARDLVNGLQVVTQDLLQIAALDAARDLVDALAQPADLERLHHDHQEQAQAGYHQHDGRPVAGKEVDHMNLRSIARSLPAPGARRLGEAAAPPPRRPGGMLSST